MPKATSISTSWSGSPPRSRTRRPECAASASRVRARSARRQSGQDRMPGQSRPNGPGPWRRKASTCCASPCMLHGCVHCCSSWRHGRRLPRRCRRLAAQASGAWGTASNPCGSSPSLAAAIAAWVRLVTRSALSTAVTCALTGAPRARVRGRSPCWPAHHHQREHLALPRRQAHVRGAMSRAAQAWSRRFLAGVAQRGFWWDVDRSR